MLVFRWLVILSCFLMLASCAEEDESNSNGLSISVGGRPPVIPLDGVDCYSQVISGAYFRLTDFQINWTRTDADLTVYSLRFEVRSTSLESDFVQVMDADALSRFMVLQNGGPFIGGVIPGTAAGDAGAVIRESCTQELEGGGSTTRPGNLSISGLSIRDGVRRFTAQVQVSLLGISTGNTAENLDEELPVRASTTFTVFYDF